MRKKIFPITFMIIIGFMIVPIYEYNLIKQYSLRIKVNKLLEMLEYTTRGITPGLPGFTIKEYYSVAFTTEKRDVLGSSPNDYIYSRILVSETHIYEEYLYVKYLLDKELPYSIHAYEGDAATLSNFINNLKGSSITYMGSYIIKRPKYFHFAGHGGKDSYNIPYIKVRKDIDPGSYEKLVPYDLYDKVGRGRLKDHTKLVFLSACYTMLNYGLKDIKKSFSYVVTSRESGLGAAYMIGYTGKIDSGVAASFAVHFYKTHLEQDKTIIEAYENSKSYIRNVSTLVSILIAIIIFILTNVFGAVTSMAAQLAGLAIPILSSLYASLILSNQLAMIKIQSSSDWSG